MLEMRNGTVLRFQKMETAEWYDVDLRCRIRGSVYAYTFAYRNEEWLINVRIAENGDLAIIELVSSSRADFTARQLIQKTIKLQRSRIEGYLYVPLSITYIDQTNNRLHYRRLSNIQQVSEEIRNSFKLDVYERVAPPQKMHSRNRLLGKLVVLIRQDEPEKMAQLYVLSRILPIV
jgi:hypothetical protein